MVLIQLDSICPSMKLKKKLGVLDDSRALTVHPFTGCDRDTYSLASQRQLCGASERAVDLLPDPQLPGSEWAENLLRDKGRAADSSMVLFDGKSGVVVPESVLSSREFPHNKFTVSTWLRHRAREDVDKHRKEHIICKADDHRECFFRELLVLNFHLSYSDRKPL